MTQEFDRFITSTLCKMIKKSFGEERVNLIKLLTRSDVNSTTSSGETFLDRMKKEKDIEAISYLRSIGAKTGEELREKNGK